ncbi:MAG: helix-turn-helix transcriptional regulator [Bacteroidia bacterium]|nr:helix-turn-helix transcriptional regulator [Bacteroidia bacterium]
MKERLIHLIELLKYRTQNDFAARIGLSGSIISQYISGLKEPGNKFWRALAMIHPEVNPEWLRDGTGSMLRSATVLQPSLPFESILSNNTENGAQIPENKAVNKEKVIEKALPEEKKNVKIDKIIIFFSDKSFQEFHPG